MSITDIQPTTAPTPPAAPAHPLVLAHGGRDRGRPRHRPGAPRDDRPHAVRLRRARGAAQGRGPRLGGGRGRFPSASPACSCSTWRRRAPPTSSSRSTTGAVRQRDGARRHGRAAADPRRRVRGGRLTSRTRTPAGSRRSPPAASRPTTSCSCRCPPGTTATRRRRAAASSATFAFQQFHPADHPWAHPVDGLTAYIDVGGPLGHPRSSTPPGSRCPQTSGNFDDPALQGAPLEGLKPIVITQPEGASFTVDGEHVTWGEWDLRIGFDTREGLILRQLSFAGRPVMYRGSISEMVVPYADPSPNRFWQNYFDTGEYLFGRYTNELELGCDCVGEITYFDAVLADELGSPRTVRNGVCMHEEDFGSLWKHTDIFTGSSEVRRSAPPRHLVLHDGRQLRLRVLLVPLPRRHDRVRGEAHRHPVHVVLPGRDGRYAVSPRRSRPDSARRTTSTCSRPAWT